MRKTVYSLLLTMLAGTAAAQTNLAGTWQGRLELAPGQSMAIHFVIAAAPGGGYTAVVTSPDSGAIKNVRATSVKFADNKLSIDVPALSGAYAGTLRNGAFEGQWSQEGTRLPLNLKPFESPSMSKEEFAQLRGDWSGALNAQGLTVTIVLRISAGPIGEVQAAIDVPEQGAKNLDGREVVLEDGHFSVKIPAASTEIKGMLRGDQIVGQWTQFGNTYPLTLKKGGRVTGGFLNLPAAARAQIKGRWKGTLNGLAVVVRFETDAQGRMQGFFDSPTQGATGLPITDASLTGTKFTFALSGFGMKYTGELAGDKLTGEWTQPGIPKPLPLALTREK